MANGNNRPRWPATVMITALARSKLCPSTEQYCFEELQPNDIHLMSSPLTPVPTSGTHSMRPYLYRILRGPTSVLVGVLFILHRHSSDSVTLSSSLFTHSMEDLSLGKWKRKKKRKRQMVHLAVESNCLSTAINLMMALAIRH